MVRSAIKKHKSRKGDKECRDERVFSFKLERLTE